MEQKPNTRLRILIIVIIAFLFLFSLYSHVIKQNKKEEEKKQWDAIHQRIVENTQKDFKEKISKIENSTKDFEKTIQSSKFNSDKDAPSKIPQKKEGTTGYSQTKGMTPVVVTSTVQDAEGVKNADLDMVGLKNLEKWIVDTVIKKSRNAYAEQGHNPNTFNPKVETKSAYVNVNGMKLAVIKVNNSNLVRAVTIFGIKGNEAYRVNCIRYSNHDIPVWSGKCGDKVKEVFGVSMQP
ncbi:MAG: hypothetical protein KBA52_08445 [Candidatus Kapabacteria bacterium]|nr:hypothetical protein [Candidatus Kapabacteria bacterium]